MFVDLTSSTYDHADAGADCGRLVGCTVVLRDRAGRAFAGTIIEGGYHAGGAFLSLRDAEGEVWGFFRERRGYARPADARWETYTNDRGEGAPLDR